MKRERSNKKSGEKRTSGRIRNILVRVFLMLLVLVSTYGILYLTVLPRQYTIKEGDVGTDIKAPRDIVDTYTTQLNIEAARDNIEDKYRQDDTISAEVIGKVESCFSAMDDVREYGQQTMNDIIDERTAAIDAYNAEQERIRLEQQAQQQDTDPEAQVTPTPAPVYTPGPTPVPVDDPVEFSQDFFATCNSMLPISFSQQDIIHLVTMEEAEYESVKNEVSRLISAAMQSGIKQEYLQNQISQINSELTSPIYAFAQGTQRLGMNIVSTYLQANFIYDEAATETARDKAESEVVDTVYKKGQNIVREGDLVSHAQFLVLQELGLIRQNEIDYQILIGLGVFLLLMMGAIALSLILFEREMLEDIRKFTVLCLVYLLALAASWGAGQYHAYLQPMGLGVLLVAVIINRRTALIMNILWAVLAGFIASGGQGEVSAEALPVVAAVLVSGVQGIYMVTRSPQRTTLLYAGAAMGVVGALMLGAFDLIAHIGWEQLLLGMGMGVAAGIIAAFFCIGTLPLWEAAFGLVTPMKLLEIANPNQPLLKRLLLEAPGSYHHSIIVGNLAESAAEAIGADVLLSRAGAYYHDIGKLSRPYFFGENQVGTENPHDSISPELSTRIITAHTRDGLALAREHRLPAPIQDAIVQHHGTTTVSFFYHKKMESAENKDEVDIQDFRYGGPRPQTREAAILMLADSVEAAVRSLNKPTPQKVEGLIRGIIKGKMDDGQLNECPLTLRDMEIIVKAFKSTLNGVFHERIEYPDLKEVEKQEQRL